MWSVGQYATMACLLEVTAPKVGNVHRGADFEDLSFVDFQAAAVAIQPAMERARTTPLGQTIRDAVVATRAVTESNTNLGIILLLAPLASVPPEEPLRAGVAAVLNNLDGEDSALVYHAIRLARPGGLGEVDDGDVHETAPPDLIAAMRLAEERDLVARQYTRDYQDVFELVLPRLTQNLGLGMELMDAIVHAQLEIMATCPDSLIARKNGVELAAEATHRAAAIVETETPGDEAYFRALADFDFWLRSDGHRRNPGTTADLIAAGLFAGMREGAICPPFHSSH